MTLAMMRCGSLGAAPWKPRTMRAAIRETSCGSSPKPSEVRPQRGSREMSTVGAKVMSRPSALASSAAMRALFSMASRSQLEARPRPMGKVVRWPWITS
ncbi:hypothetical protein D3C80_1849980 [compost metagenome]